MLNVNALVQEAAELCSMTGDGEAVDGNIDKSGEGTAEFAAEGIEFYVKKK